MAEDNANVLHDVRTQFQGFFESLTLAKKITLFAILAVVLMGMATLIYVANREAWVPLYSNISTEDAALVKEKLNQNQIATLVGAGGRSILVPAGKADDARLVLARERVSLGGGLGFADLFIGKTGIGETEFQQQVKYRMALEGELARLIGKISAVRSAKVTLALPKKSLFVGKDEEKPTASVLVELHPGAELERGEVLTVAQLVANSVEGLNRKNVVVVDSRGTMLTPDPNDAGAANISDQFSIRRRVEQQLETKIVNQLEPVVGQGRVRAHVSADLEFDKISTQQEIFDPEGVVVRSEQTTTENSTGTRSIPVGVPGVTSNLPETQAGASEVANVSQLARTSATRNFETSRRTVVSEPSVGKVNRLSVSVLIDGKYKPITDPESGRVITREYQEWTTDEKREITRLVKAAVGFTEKRGDVLEVVNMRFSKAQEEDVSRQIEQTARNRAFFLDILRYTFLGVGLLALIMFVIRPMVQRLSAKPEDLDLLMGLPATIGELEGEELEIPTEKEAGIPPRDKILDVARADPLATASLIRAWLRDKR
ncbi:MAG: flagellar M-ring protein FliF [Candidatus Lambdaproteobacteria bacterium]|nr:flagellar M-ring protein FliF [Candidatus Lambdaproteobacteria bacterium]